MRTENCIHITVSTVQYPQYSILRTVSSVQYGHYVTSIFAVAQKSTNGLMSRDGTKEGALPRSLFTLVVVPQLCA